MRFALFVLLGFVGLAIDLGQAYIVKTTRRRRWMRQH